jgi:Type I phosphodiesterase / nucleotide pyrophosphatase
MRRMRASALVALFVAALGAVGLAVAGVSAPATGTATAALTTCRLGNGAGSIQHVVYLQFDNTHYRRDRANVASDLEQMPHLLGFLRNNGTLFTNDHTVLISHTAGGIVSTLTGLYPDRNGQTVSNSYDFYKNNGFPSFTSSFKYWTDTVDGADDSLPNMVTGGGATTPAPWLTYTHAGCDVGGVSAANIELENTSTAPSGDMTRVFGAGSPEWNEAANPATRSKAQADFVGIAIHCALGSSLCDSQNARPDDATTQPGSSDGYKALFGAKYVNPAINGGNGCVLNTEGQPITDPAGNCGFPGFDGALAKNTLGEVAQMQEAGVPITYAYISDAHDNHTLGRASGPGESDYVAQLKAYDNAFATFFTRLAADGIDRSNTLFVVTVDEGDHFAGGVGTPQPDGSLAYNHAPCSQVNLQSCPANQIGEVNAKIGALLPAGEPGYDIHFDDAPTFYVNGQPARTDPAVRKLERDLGTATTYDPYVGAVVPIAQRLADTVEEKTLHMINADPKRTPTLTMFGNPDFFFQTTTPSCGGNVCVNPGFAWNHGNSQEEIGNTWVGFVGPGVRNLGVDSTTWTDHTNVRPTINELLGLQDGYRDDGRVLVEGLKPQAIASSLRAHRETLLRLGAAYEQVNAPFGQFAMDTLSASTRALQSTDDAVYTSIEDRIADLTAQRDSVALQISAALNASAGGTPLDERQAKAWIELADSLLAQAQTLAAG